MDENKLDTLFDLLCDDFKSLLDKDEPMTAADRKLLLEFLRDNEVSCVGENNKNIQSVIETLPFSDEVEEKRATNQ